MGTEEKNLATWGEVTKQDIRTSAQRHVKHITEHRTIKKKTRDQIEQITRKNPMFCLKLLIQKLRGN